MSLSIDKKTMIAAAAKSLWLAAECEPHKAMKLVAKMDPPSAEEAGELVEQLLLVARDTVPEGTLVLSFKLEPNDTIVTAPIVVQANTPGAPRIELSIHTGRNAKVWFRLRDRVFSFTCLDLTRAWFALLRGPGDDPEPQKVTKPSAADLKLVN